MIVRPPEYLEDVRERELEMQAAEARLAQLNYLLCPYCDYEIEKDFLRCPSCMRKLKDPCVHCRRPLDPTWTLCPYCETEVLGASSSRRVRQRRETGEEAALEAPPPGI
jgi:predicted amidophosphoribosyltransferase